MIRRLLPLLLGVAAIGLCAHAPAAAHEGQGTIEVLAADTSSPDAISYRVRVVFVADGHPAPEATVTATIVNQSGAVPVTFVKTADDGTYEGTVRFPGSGNWTVRLTSLRPIASVERTETITAAPNPTSSAPTSSTEPRTSIPEPRTTDEPSGANWTLVLVVAAATAAAVAAAFVVARRRQTGR